MPKLAMIFMILGSVILENRFVYLEHWFQQKLYFKSTAFAEFSAANK